MKLTGIDYYSVGLSPDTYLAGAQLKQISKKYTPPITDNGARFGKQDRLDDLQQPLKDVTSK